ncbi:MAG: 4Fe-4S binding protein [Thermodesulfobacteriota bacterium]|nr:4Fe-4S binding protein [Thermodesulfobacteriota bacterium]
MKIDSEKCSNCGICQPYCTVGAIQERKEDETRRVVEDECVECGVCLRADVCPTDAIYQQELTWPRIVRQEFSNPLIRHPSTDIGGRGTEEMKTNEVTNRFQAGFVGVGLEFGRPSVGTRFIDVQTMALALAPFGVQFETQNPVTTLMVDKGKGLLKPEVLNEKVLSAIIEFLIPLEKLEEIFKTIKEVAPKLKTVITLEMISRIGEDGAIPTLPIAKKAGFTIRPNTKTNVGLGRPGK